MNHVAVDHSGTLNLCIAHVEPVGCDELRAKLDSALIFW